MDLPSRFAELQCRVGQREVDSPPEIEDQTVDRCPWKRHVEDREQGPELENVRIARYRFSSGN